jgi:hypothetical protein
LLRHRQCGHALEASGAEGRGANLIGTILVRLHASIEHRTKHAGDFFTRVGSTGKRKLYGAAHAHEAAAAIVATAARRAIIAEGTQQHLLTAERRTAELLQQRQSRRPFVLAVGVRNFGELKAASRQFMRRI